MSDVEGRPTQSERGPWRPSSTTVKLLVCGALIAGAVTYLVTTAMSTTMVYYVTVPELKAGTGAATRDAVRLAGVVIGSTIERQGTQVRFVVTDAVSGERLPVTFKGVVPDIFGDGIEVVVEGRYARDQGLFEAQTLLAKCPSKFEGGPQASAHLAADP